MTAPIAGTRQAHEPVRATGREQHPARSVATLRPASGKVVQAPTDEVTRRHAEHRRQRSP
jgi:hypothetical protein